MNKKNKPGLLISFEGIDCSGKTTIINELIEAKTLNIFLTQGFTEIIFTSEPGSPLISFCQKIRKILLEKNYNLSPLTQAFLFAANRAEHVRKLIKPKLKEGAIILTDRYVDSSYMYQGMDPSLNLALIEQINHYAVEDIYPDITFCFIIDETIWEKRINKKEENNELDNVEKQYKNFNHMCNVFLKLIEQYSKQGRKYCLINSENSIDQIILFIKEEIQKLICSTIKTDHKHS